MVLLTKCWIDVIPDRRVFCNSPWYELHIYWDGALAFCCHATPRVPYDTQFKSQYNIKHMTIQQWYDSPPMRDARLRMFSDQRWDHCDACWHEESVSGTSRRHRSNQKSVIFHQAFDDSMVQSPSWPKFQHSAENLGAHADLPIDLHIDLGNYCNLACKMCNPQASSRIASQHQQWGILNTSAQDWTRDTTTWERFKQELLHIPQIKNIHFMGGETMIQPRFRDLVNTLLENDRTDVCMSFVTNGTYFDADLIQSLKSFKRVGIEVSIEATDQVNDYVRQGTVTKQVLANIDQYMGACDRSSISVALRPAPSLLTARSYWQVIELALQKRLIIKSNICTDPSFLRIELLPDDVKSLYLKSYIDLMHRWNLDDIKSLSDINQSDPNNYRAMAMNQIRLMINLLQSPAPADQDHMLSLMVDHVKKWDPIYGFNACDIYPELVHVLQNHGY